MPPEVLIYVQKIKNFFSINEGAKKYFLNDIDEELFFKYLMEISQKNFEKDGDASLSEMQFELIRKTLIVKSISEGKFDSKIFVSLDNWGDICLN